MSSLRAPYSDFVDVSNETQTLSFVTDIINTTPGGAISLDADAGIVTYRQPNLSPYLTQMPSTNSVATDFTNSVNFEGPSTWMRQLSSEGSGSPQSMSEHFKIGALSFRSQRHNNNQFTEINNVNDLFVASIGAYSGSSNIYIRNQLTGNHGLTSDDRLKSRTTPITNALQIIQQLNPVTYQKHPDFLVPEGIEDADLTGVTHNFESGMIAQELENIPELSHLVSHFTHPDLHIQLKSVSYDQLIPYLVKSIQELSARVTSLES